MKLYKRFGCVALTGVLVLSTITSAIASEQDVMAVSTNDTATENVPLASDGVYGKEEVIYINLASNGSVKDVYAVNIFGSGDITDYGDYSSVEILNTTDDITMEGDRVTFKTDKDRVYYKGKLDSAVIPWNITIEYYIDGVQYTADDVAGKSGGLEIHFKVTENDVCEGSFYEDYALQASFTLDTKKCSNIAADGATMANVGSKKQISYTMLPGQGIDTVITADVKEFEMAAVAINGVPLSMNIEVEDEELMSQVTELLEAIKKLDDGAKELNDGSVELKDGGEALGEGAAELEVGVDALCDGMSSLNEGVILLENGLLELNTKSDDLISGSTEIKNALITIQKELSAVSATSAQIEQLVSGSSQIKTAIDLLYGGAVELQNSVSFTAYKNIMKLNGLDIDTLQTSNAQTIQNLNAQIITLNQNIAALEQIGGYETDIAELKATVEQLQGIVQLLSGNSAAISGTEAYLTEINSGIGELISGIGELKENYATFDAAINALATELANLMADMVNLKGGIDTLVTAYSKLDGGIQEYTGGVAQLVAGYAELVSGTENLLSGSRELKDGTTILVEGVTELIDGISELGDGTAELKEGTSTLREETDGMDKEISDKIDEMLESFTGGNGEVVSFVSEKNEDVKAVQFVIQTEVIEIDEAEEVEAEPETEKGFWEKLLNLFGWD